MDSPNHSDQVNVCLVDFATPTSATHLLFRKVTIPSLTIFNGHQKAHFVPLYVSRTKQFCAVRERLMKSIHVFSVCDSDRQLLQQLRQQGNSAAVQQGSSVDKHLGQVTN